MTIYYISGHLDLTPEEFRDHYESRLREAMAGGCSFVVGDAKGADAMAQSLLVSYDASKVTVYHMFTSPRHNLGSFATRGGFTSDRERDEAMTASSSDDIAWVRPGREKSGTAKNLKRRHKK